MSASDPTPAQDLQAAPQLALRFERGSGAARVEVELQAGSGWRSLPVAPPTATRAWAQVSELEQNATLTFDPLGAPLDAPREGSAEDERESSAEGELETQPASLSGAGAGSISADPCALFDPQSGALRLSLTPLRESITRGWGGAHPDAGKVALTRLRIHALDPARPVRLRGVAYRRWR